MATSKPTDSKVAAGQVTLGTKNKTSFKVWLRDKGWRHAVMWVAMAFALYPVLWMISAAFNTFNTLGASNLIPTSVTLDNFKELFTNPLLPVGRWLWNSFYIAFVVATIQVFMSASAAFAFSRLEWRGRRAGLLIVLLIQVFPQYLAFVAILLLVRGIGDIFPVAGLNTHLGLILVYLGGSIGINTWLIKGFMDTIPFSLDEAAVVDGASHFDIFYRVILPLTRPVLGVVFIITFVFIYGEYILASVLLSDTNLYTLPRGLFLMISDSYTANWGGLAAASVLASIPVIAVYIPMQDQLVGGLTSGAVKG